MCHPDSTVHLRMWGEIIKKSASTVASNSGIKYLVTYHTVLKGTITWYKKLANVLLSIAVVNARIVLTDTTPS